MTHKVAITRRITFSAAHRLHNDALSEEQNRTLFGKCNYSNGHGHNFTVEVTVLGPIDPETGMVFNLRDLNKIMTDTIEKQFDHKNLNLDIPAFKNLNPTAENIVVVIWDMLQEHLPAGLLNEVRLLETENNYASYRGHV